MRDDTPLGRSRHVDGAHPHLRLKLGEPITLTEGEEGGGQTVILAADPLAGVRVRTDVEMDPYGVVRIRHTIGNAGPGVLTLDGAACLLPAGDQATEALTSPAAGPTSAARSASRSSTA